MGYSKDMMGHPGLVGEPGAEGVAGKMGDSWGDPGPKMENPNMNFEEVLKRMDSHDLKDEMEVSNKYLDYAVTAEHCGKDCIARRIYEMAYEEYTHARFQMELLIDCGWTIDDECRVMYEKLEHRLHTLFRES